MEKIKKKIQLISPYNIGAYESWLSDNAEKGLFLYKWKKYFCQFEKREPMKMEYRVDVSTESLTLERKQLYEDAGWEYIDSLKMAHIFSSPTEEKTIEIHTDSVEQAKTLVGLKSNLKALLIIFSILFIFNLGLNSWFIFENGVPFYNFVNFGNSLFGIITYLILIVIFFKQFNDIRTLKKSLLRGSKIDHHKNWKKSYVIELIIIFIDFILLLAIVFSMITSITSHDWKVSNSLISRNNNTPIIILTDLEDVDKHISSNKELVIKSHIVKQKNFLISSKYESDESVDAMDQSFSAFLDTKYYEVSLDLFAKGLLDDLIKIGKKSVLEFPDRTFEIKKVGNDYFDEVYYFEDYSSGILIRKDNIVMEIRYEGTQTREYLLEKLEENMKSE